MLSRLMRNLLKLPWKDVEAELYQPCEIASMNFDYDTDVMIPDSRPNYRYGYCKTENSRELVGYDTRSMLRLQCSVLTSRDRDLERITWWLDRGSRHTGTYRYLLPRFRQTTSSPTCCFSSHRSSGSCIVHLDLASSKTALDYD
jgi:hypothetical protein